MAVRKAVAEEVQLSSLDLTVAQQRVGYAGSRPIRGRKCAFDWGQKYASGFGTHAAGEQCIALKGRSTRFTASVGINDESGTSGSKGSVVFLVEGDGRELWLSS